MNCRTDELTPYAPGDLLGLAPRLAWRRIVVVGDLFLDEYIEGRAARLSREAPVPVIEFERRFFRPGGAANPPQNIVALDGRAWMVGVVGDDESGRQLISEMKEGGIDTTGVVVDASRPTTTKTRIVAQGNLRFPQQVARVDRVDRRPIDGAVQADLGCQLAALVPVADAVLVSDYRAGVATEAVIGAALAAARDHGKLAVVDTQGNLGQYKDFDLVKCNQGEAEAALKRELVTRTQIQEACEDLLTGLRAGAVVITRGAQGMAGMSRQEGLIILPAANRTEVYDVVGAGDTAVAVLTMALAARLPFAAAMQLSNYAAGLVVRKIGNATTTQRELCWAIEHW
jgi:D-glycero-beta-D-manno-heptose-7-phosphate kinase